LDIGANFGEVGLYAAKFVGPSGQVHVFEPQAKLANLIRVSAELNGFKHVHTHEVALSGKDGQFNFFVPRGYTCVGSLAADTSSSSEIDVMKVQARKAGTYLEQLKLPRIRVIKVDVEGHEEQILSGALDFLRSNKPAAIIFESHDSGQAFFDRNVVKQIASLGYNFYQIKQKVLLRVRLKKLQYNESIENGYDFVALSSEPEDKNVYRLLGVS
jgi:FkbM family methyltransferase